VFAPAQLAGLEHFVVEQDNAAAWGDSLAAAKRVLRTANPADDCGGLSRSVGSCQIVADIFTVFQTRSSTGARPSGFLQAKLGITCG